MIERSRQRVGAGSAYGTARGRARVPLVGREREMSLLASAVVACAEGVSTIVEISGDPGLGKTRLLSELGAMARAAGLTVLSGRASEFGRQRSLGVFADTARRYTDRRYTDRPTRSRRGTLDEGTAALLEPVRLFEGGSDTARPRFRDVERHRLRHRVDRLLAEAGPDRGVLLRLDDLHWADEGTLELLHHLLRNPPGTPLLLACGHRPRQAPAKLLASFQHAACDYRVVTLALSTLDRQACDILLGTGHTPARREHLCAISGGNPLYLEALRETIRVDADTPEGFKEPPDTLRAALAREIAVLTEDELTMLRAAAVLGDPVDATLLAPVAGLGTEAALAALDVLAGMDLIRTGGPPDLRQLRFRHPLLREVVSRDAPPGWWLAAHARADGALRERGASAVERAPYLARSAEPGDAEAIGILAEAANLTAHSSPATAVAWLRAALRLSAADRSEESPRRRLRMLLGLAAAYGTSGDLSACRDALGQALDLVPSDEREQRIPVVALRSTVERVLGSAQAARRALERELALWPETDTRANPLRLQLATVDMVQGNIDEATAHLDTVLARTPAPVDRRTLTAVAACRALGAAYSGRTAALRAYTTDAAASIDVMEDEELASFLDEVGQLGWAEVLGERHHDAIRHTTRGVRIARRTGQSHLLPYLLLCLSQAQQSTGDLAGAIRSAADAEEAASLIDRPELAGYALTLNAAATALRDGPDAAAPAAERALRSVGRRGRLWDLSAAVLASVRLDQDRPDDCVALLRSITATDRSRTTRGLRPMWYCMAAQAEMSRGHVAEARSWAALTEEAAASVELPGQRGYAFMAMACVRRDDPSAAAELYAAAEQSFAAGGLVLAEARACLLLGRALVCAGRLDDAVTAVGRAKRIADAHGAGYLGALAVNAQRRIGARRRRSGAGDGPYRLLSEQERRISDMVTRGLTNRDIAAGLFVSVKTVEANLTRIFRKLEVTSRSGLVGRLADLRDAPTGA